MAITQREIIEYYDECETHYRWLWNLESSLAMHAGFWDATTKTLAEALERENHVLAETAKIKSSDHVLDAGCGVGGSSIYLAKNYGCHVTGITLSAKQVETATEIAKQRITQGPLPKFLVRDYTQTELPSESFDVIWGIESICHAEKKEDFLREAHRLLRKNGRIVIADAFLTKHHYIKKEQEMMDNWLRGWGVDSLEREVDFAEHLQNVGFSKIHFSDMTQQVIPSSKRLYMYSIPTMGLSKVCEWFGLSSPRLTSNLVSAYYQYKAVQEKLWRYGIFYAEK
jgi:cyclopropane fatty-acyl-phospholipid synthase-like methyltransferase